MLFIVVVLVISLWLGVYFTLLYKERKLSPSKSLLTNHVYLSDTELEEELIFFLAKELEIYQGEFEIVDIVNLSTHEIAGADYILITLRAPNGNLYQIVVSRKAGPGTKWELNPKNLSLVDLPKYDFGFSKETTQWMKELGITPEQAFEYFKAHPDMYLKGEYVFFDEKTGKHRLPSDWFQTVKLETQYKLLVNKNEPIRSVPSIKKEEIGSLWKIDYPSQYLGPGYRAYLYGKIKGKK